MQAADPKPKPKWILMPDSLFRKLWVQFQLLIALYIIWVTPIRVGFDMQAQGFWFWMEGVMNLFFWADLVMNFFVAYENPVSGEIITDHKKIALRYLKGWFVVDLLATFPSDYIVKAVQGTFSCSFVNNCYYVEPKNTNVVLIALLRVMRIFRIFWIFKNFNLLSINTVIGKLQYELLGLFWIISVFELLIVLVFMGHLTGCFFYMFGGSVYWRTQEEKDLIAIGVLRTWVLEKFGGYYITQVPDVFQGDGNSTVPTDQVAQDPVTGIWYICPDLYTIIPCPNCQGPHYRCQALLSFAYRYITAMYWGYTTMTTVGYGDIVGFIIAEKVWCMVTMVCGGFFLSFCFGRMANIVGRLDAEKSARSEQMDQVTQFLKDVDLPKPLSRKILDFYSTSARDVKPYDRNAMLLRLPFEMRSKIMNHLYLPTIKAVPVLQRFAEDELFLTELCTRLHPYRCSAETFVYQRGEPQGDLYILLRGDMHVLDTDRRSFLFKVPEGRVFGEAVALRRIEGDSKARRAENVLCKSECDMLRLSAEDVAEMCEHYPQLYKDLHKLDKSRQARYKLTYGTAATLESPFRVPDEANKDAGWLTSLPASGLSQIQEHGPMLADAKSVARMLLDANGGVLSGGPTAASSFPEEMTSHALREGLLGEELILLRKQVEEQQSSMQKQMEVQRELLNQLLLQQKQQLDFAKSGVPASMAEDSAAAVNGWMKGMQ